MKVKWTVIVAVCAILMTGLILLIYRNQHHSNWKSASLQYEKMSYQYPNSWLRSSQSVAIPESLHYCTYPGQDLVTLNSPTQSQVTLDAGQACPKTLQSRVFGSVPITAFGKNMYLVFEAPVGLPGTDPTEPTAACLAQSPQPKSTFDFISKNIFVNKSVAPTLVPVNSFCYAPHHAPVKTGVLPTFTVNQIKDSPDFTTAKKIFESLHY